MYVPSLLQEAAPSAYPRSGHSPCRYRRLPPRRRWLTPTPTPTRSSRMTSAGSAAGHFPRTTSLSRGGREARKRGGRSGARPKLQRPPQPRRRKGNRKRVAGSRAAAVAMARAPVAEGASLAARGETCRSRRRRRRRRRPAVRDKRRNCVDGFIARSEAMRGMYENI